MRAILGALLVTALAIGVPPAPAGDPEVPEKYMSVDEVRALLDQKKRVKFVDVRPRSQYEELHIRGALNIPLADLPARLGEISKQDFVVLY
jgi:rhodanese-related sulfurtransferase